MRPPILTRRDPSAGYGFLALIAIEAEYTDDTYITIEIYNTNETFFDSEAADQILLGIKYTNETNINRAAENVGETNINRVAENVGETNMRTQ